MTSIPLQKRQTLRNDRGSLPMAILVMIVGVGLAALLLPMLLTQSSTTRFDERRAVSLHAAESGLDAALGMIRNSVSYDEKAMSLRGDARKLPCGPMNGTVDPTSGATYSVAITYYASDPAGKDDTWLAKNAMSCVSGFGVHFDDGSSKGILVPSFAIITSKGTNGTSPVGRTLQATYTVKTTNVNIDGGAMPLFPASGDPGATIYCLDAGADPRVGSAVRIQQCSEDKVTPKTQRWSYRSNLTIRLAATVNDAAINPNGAGLCLSAISAGATLQLCPEDGTDSNGNPELPADYKLIWGINDVGHFAQSNSTKSTLSGSCLNASDLRSDGGVNLAPCLGGTTDPHQAFNPRPTVGSGQAGPDKADPNFLTNPAAKGKQVVNFLQFSRCIDVTNQKTDLGTAEDPNGGTTLILYPCKQNPAPSAVAWNQRFTQVNATGDVQWQTTKSDGTTYCVTSPRSAYNADTNRKYVNVTLCASGNSAQIWTRYEGSTGEGPSAVALPTKQRYTLVDSAGLCLAPSANEDMYKQNLKTVVAPCDGSLGQKWNVPPMEQFSTVTNLHESSIREG